MATRMIIPPTRATAAANELRRRILGGEYPGGMPLRQAAIAAELGISRIPFREALIQLEAEGLVHMEAHKGAVVASIAAADVEEVFELRALLEPRLLLHSAPHLTAADFARAHAILREYSEELRLHHVERWGELNTELHALLYHRAGRPKTLAFVDQLLQASDHFTRIQLALTDGRTRAEREHAAIVAACESGAHAEAARCLQEHIENVGQQLVAFLGTRQPASNPASPRDDA
jgi:DNA-binding GntR family transcriptional regulator